ncbi:MAG: polysaccharide biosynthesis tyrosine autokinase [Rothia sp. (in: high G+C Gram-positive bacteria)]|uniref:polysaccharide biosynthesis tyrosine autokinase n=1 Tax=Rothia sp. (in: high G+C Gram-positive bacteria) TaxID=1885016 RepID=UPI0026DEAB15|nr:polysaccharide biosynthesis tyrosine autokinase [Rothia sp. (in: high G+C Gram-positive bacteria)]MDO5750285.1 polysaccharide biosynthesis tyrosine autokinase [Rothia sp. (in: high G+C Gram-positive bacteria)]
MTILDFVRLTRANLWLLVTGIIVGTLLGYGYAAMQPKTYQAKASGYVTIGSSGTVDVLSGSSAARERAQSYSAIVTSQSVAQKMKASSPELANMSVGAIQGSLTAGVGEGRGALIEVTAKASNPEQARALANGALRATAEYISEIDGSSASTANESEGSSAVRNASSVRVIPLDNASPTPALIQVNAMQYAGIGAGAGLAAVYAAIFLRRALDSRIRTRDDAIKATESSILGVMPVSDELTEDAIAEGKSDDHIAQESIRQLRTNLRFVNIDTPPRSFIVTSSVPGEGKSTVSLSLARAMAAAGQPVILIDADLRRPTVAKKLKLNAKVGLTQVLAGQVDIANAVLPAAEEENLFILPAGRIPPNPAELLGSDKMRQLIKELSEEFVVILDVPPLLPVTDASLLSTSVDGVILVGAVGKSHREQMTEAVSVLNKVNANLFGVVLNRAPRSGLGNSYYGFGYASSYVGYATYYGYSKDGKKKTQS